MAGTFSSLHYHLVFSTKNRAELITDPEFEKRLHDYLGGSIRGMGGMSHLINGTADHIHMLIRWIPNGNISHLMRDVKSQSSKWVHENYTELCHFKWQEGFGAFSVSYSNLDAVLKYIARQKEHHKKTGFQPEFRGLLRRHHIEYDEKTIWL